MMAMAIVLIVFRFPIIIKIKIQKEMIGGGGGRVSYSKLKHNSTIIGGFWDTAMNLNQVSFISHLKTIDSISKAMCILYIKYFPLVLRQLLYSKFPCATETQLITSVNIIKKNFLNWILFPFSKHSSASQKKIA